MRVLPFTKYSPCGNTTILVRESSLSPADRARVAAEIIAPGHLEAEQAGYVDTAAPVPRLDMMGGEFCVNATRAFAALLAEERKLSSESGGLGGIVSVSGMPERLRVRVRRLAAHRFESAVLLDLPQAPPLENVAPGMYLVRVPGIAHLVLDAAAHPLPADKDRDTAALFARFGLLGEDAAGCIWLHREPSGLRITPFVWVRGTGTTYAETACGSGTLAASIVCRGVYGDGGELSLMQPGGEPLRVVPDGSAYPGGWAAWVGGPVRRIARGDVFVECLDGEGRWPRTIDTLLCGRCFIQLSYPSTMAGQARQIALRKLEVAVLSHGAFQAQRNGFCALLSDVLACYLSFTHASRLQDFIQIGRTGASITASQAINLKCKAVQMRCQAGHEIELNNDLVALVVYTVDSDGADVPVAKHFNQLFCCCSGFYGSRTFNIDDCLFHKFHLLSIYCFIE